MGESKTKPNQTKLKMKYFFTLALLNAAAMAKRKIITEQ